MRCGGSYKGRCQSQLKDENRVKWIYRAGRQPHANRDKHRWSHRLRLLPLLPDLSHRQRTSLALRLCSPASPLALPAAPPSPVSHPRAAHRPPRAPSSSTSPYPANRPPRHIIACPRLIHSPANFPYDSVHRNAPPNTRLPSLT